MSTEILYKLLGKPLSPELGKQIKNKCLEYRERAELLKSLSEKRRREKISEKNETISTILHGPEIGLKAIEIIRNAIREIMIMSYLLFEVKTIKSEKQIHQINLLDTLIQKSKNGTIIRIITSPPDIHLLGANVWKQSNSIKRLSTESNVQIKLCNYAHFKFIVADSRLVFRGSANLTHTGLSGRGDTAEITNDEYIVNYYTTLFNERWRNIHKSCRNCNEKVCTKEYSI
jgi:phosphatidylserine/phosphatidylglycerophosphate/cardiolipin synthase-like enzyme